jgi:hypothetical protein
VRFFAECVGLVAICVVGFIIARRLRWDLFGGILAAGMFGVLVGAPVTFVGWLVSRSEWLEQSRSVLWVGGALLIGGIFLVQIAFLFEVPLAAHKNKEGPPPSDNHERAG